MNSLQHLFEKNSAWATAITQEDPDFFLQLSKQQTPDYLWIGCADSRVPASQVIGLLPGEVFVHRNIANVVVHTDLNCLSVIQYAVEVLKVKHVIVCGHYGCGGVNAALSGQEHGLIDNWLCHVKDVYRSHKETLDSLADADKLATLCELNVMAQVDKVCQTTIVQKAWKQQANLSVHGLIYDLESGLLKELTTVIR